MAGQGLGSGAEQPSSTQISERRGFIKRITSLFKQKSAVSIFIFLLISLNGCFSTHLQVNTLTKHYAILSYDHGAMIPQVDENMRVRKIKEVCPGNYCSDVFN